MNSKMRSLMYFISNRVVFFAVPFLLQLGIILVIIVLLNDYITLVQGLMNLIALGIVVFIVNKKDNPAYKIGWIIIILVVPIFGAFIYLFYGGKKLPKSLSKKIEKIKGKTQDLFPQDEAVLEDIKKTSIVPWGQARYLLREGFPVYENTSVDFLPSGEEKLEALLSDLKKARHYIFLQYFIIREGEMWDSILEVLKEKALQGLDVRVMFDDMGCITTLPPRYERTIRKLGIKCYVSNPLRVYKNFTMVQNNRDHRKIVVIDGHTGYTGGINLGDEYINKMERFGHWKDCAVRIKGEAVWTLTLTFLQNWMLYDDSKQDFEKYKPSRYLDEKIRAKGYVQPYEDSPLDYNNVGENTYLNIINDATEELLIATPYLILTNEMLTALRLAAARGVDVKILTPHVPDKKTVFLLTQSFYGPLIEEGVKIFEYTPGFVHSKTFIADGEIGVCGTINLDYRSLYLHFEDAVWMYKCKAVSHMREDYIKSLSVSKEITRRDIATWTTGKRIFQAILRVLAPLM